MRRSATFLEININLIHEYEKEEYFISGNILENSAVIAHCLLIKLKYFIIGTNKFILEISSEAEYQDIKIIGGKPEKKLMLSIFDGIDSRKLAKEIIPLIKYLKTRIYDSPFCFKNDSIEKEFLDRDKVRKLSSEFANSKERIVIQTKPAGRPNYPNHDKAFEFFLNNHTPEETFTYWCELEGIPEADKVEKKRFKQAFRNRYIKHKKRTK